MQRRGRSPIRKDKELIKITIMTKNDFLKTYKEVMGVELTWMDVWCGLAVVCVFIGFCLIGEIFG